MATENDKSTKKAKDAEAETKTSKKTVEAEVVSESKKTAGSSSVNIDNKTMILLAHGLGILTSFIAPLIIYLVTEDKLVKQHAAAALNFQISLAIYGTAFAILSSTVGAILVLLTFGLFGLVLLLLALVLGAYWLIPPIIAMVKVSEDVKNVYSYPLAITFVK